MCAIDDAEPFKVYREEKRTARKSWRCIECARDIQQGEQYRFMAGLTDNGWMNYRTCAHCSAAGHWLHEVCGGYPISMLREELVEHWHEGFRSISFARLVVGQKRQWHGGRDPIPALVKDMAKAMLREQVAA